jgi:hypothetical protein
MNAGELDAIAFDEMVFLNDVAGHLVTGDVMRGRLRGRGDRLYRQSLRRSGGLRRRGLAATTTREHSQLRDIAHL